MTAPQLPQAREGLFHAAATGDLAGLQEALKTWHSHERDEHGWTPLMLSAAGGHVACIKHLCHISDPRLTTPQGYTPLMLACDSGNLRCVELLQPLSPLNFQDIDGCTALMRAAYKGSSAIVELLLPGSAPDLMNTQGWSALMIATRLGHLECVKTLLPHSNLMLFDMNGRGLRELAGAQDNPVLTELIEKSVLRCKLQHFEPATPSLTPRPTQLLQRPSTAPQLGS